MMRFVMSPAIPLNSLNKSILLLLLSLNVPKNYWNRCDSADPEVTDESMCTTTDYSL